MRTLFPACVALVALTACGPAGAADVAVKAPVHQAQPAVVGSGWTGFYVGLGLGTRSTRTNGSVTSFALDGVDQLTANCAAPGGCIPGEPLNDTAFRLSPYVGINWQFAPQWVVGVEADWGSANKTTTLAGLVHPGNALVSGNAADRFSVRTTWDAALRGRVGFLADPSILIYATGGAAWLHLEATSNCNTLINGPCSPSPPSGPAVIVNSTTRSGWTAGGGIEAMLWSNWIARGEYRYADFGTVSNTDARNVIGTIAAVTSYDLRLRTHTATFGLAYKLGGDPAAAPATAHLTAPAVASSWSGPYLGLGLGTRSTRTDAAVTAYTIGGANAFACTIVAFGGCVTGAPLNDTAFRVSPYLGFNWQFAPQWVVGVEGDWGLANKTTTLAGMIYPHISQFTGRGADTFGVKTSWDAGARGRIGFLARPSVLVYATGGAAWMHIESTSSCNRIPFTGPCGPAGFNPADIANARTKIGWTVGGGIEGMLRPNWIARAEYRYADFGTISNTDTRTGAALPTQVVSYDLRLKTHTATLGLAYKFDWGGPVVAKY